ncbi:endonuclease [Flavobacterium aurantiibacter]|uniref:Secretion system C-terminal sorting domain-containing protein n=1 Tax=Flavobacterium aurantiibacter TaxID=2023067 RepID=A0A255ZZM1_9FLAO|nr:endonuclease [Flavobacterium aurantiibacter]OYQ46933.1 hypothetical protein CHX27_03640 [Flavobacterium aurantiibacter]
MKKIWGKFICLLLVCVSAQAQIFINELDADTPGTDVLEFIELKTLNPNQSLTGYVLVAFNGGQPNNPSYFAMDLDGFTTDSDGIILIGNQGLSPFPDQILPDNTFQNGADAVAIYLGNASDWPLNTPCTNTNLISALAYDTNDPDATSLLAALGLTEQINEGVNGSSQTESIQRKNDGTYEVKAPTPGAPNDGSGSSANGLTAQLSATNVTEGNTVTLTFSLQQPAQTAFTFTFTLENGGFTASDYQTTTTVSFAAGSQSAAVSITFIDDSFDEGDEDARSFINALPSGYERLNNNVIIRVVDNDFQALNYGTPVNPTYGNVIPSIPAGYYDSLNGKAGNELKAAIQAIIANSTLVREHTYGDVFEILKAADVNPENPNQVWLMYVEQPRSKLDQQTGTSGASGFWNREHIYPQSRGGFTDGTSGSADGFNLFDTTGPDDILAGHSDAHHIRAEDSPENSLRSERNYGIDYNGPANTLSSWHGDVARALFYMAVRYNGLNVVNGNPPTVPVGFVGDLATLLQWNALDTADDFEMNHNNVVHLWQQNRNPFVDMPLLAEYVFGANFGQVWNNSLTTTDYANKEVRLYPNPASDVVYFTKSLSNATVSIFNISGQRVYHADNFSATSLQLELTSGVYFVEIRSESRRSVQKLIVR